MIELEEIRDTTTTVEVEPNLQQPVVESHVPRRSERIIRPLARYTLLHEQGHDEPSDGCDSRNFKEAISYAESSKWLEAMQSEMDSMYSNQVWTLVDPPEEIVPIGCKWIYKRKLGADGKVLTFKARLVAKGYTQRQGVDYEETFPPVAMFKSIRILLA
ncbi:uncharacterized mitochondrial protein AtMg00820-like [Henckelia pumila]|uniref:uncharacterized mitochondrial protein AtMg00820-like n=1 Tax=Henckelia pumila TaxID=405737 RepID=UPI003C6DE557